VRRDIAAMPLPRGKTYKGPADDASWGRIIELTDAPAVDFQPGQSRPVMDQVDPAERGVVTATSRSPSRG
jgi:hypothetical protein